MTATPPEPPPPPFGPSGPGTPPPYLPPPIPTGPPQFPTSATPPPPPPGDSRPSRAPVVVALVAVIVVAAIAAAIVVFGGDDEGTPAATATTTTPIRSEASAPGDGGPDADESRTDITVEGRDLPTSADTDPAGVDAAVGRTIPTITGQGYDGRPVTIEPGRAQIIVLMAHWCPHCQREIPNIVEWAGDGLLPDDVQIVGVSTVVDEARGNYPPPSWLEREGWEFPVLADDDEYTAFDALGGDSFPTLIAVTADGEVAMRSWGESDEATFTELVEAAQG